MIMMNAIQAKMALLGVDIEKQGWQSKYEYYVFSFYYSFSIK